MNLRSHPEGQPKGWSGKTGLSAGAAMVALAIVAGTVGTAVEADAAAGDNWVLGASNKSGQPTYLNWPTATAPLTKVGLAVEGEQTGAVFATNGDYTVEQGGVPWYVGVAGYGNDIGGYFFGPNGGVEAHGWDYGVIAGARDGPGVEARGNPAVEAIGSRVGIIASGDVAVRAEGAVSFSSAGLATVPAGASTVTVAPGADVTSGSQVLATAQSSGGQVLRVRRNSAADTVTIILVSPATKNVKVAFFVIG